MKVYDGAGDGRRVTVSFETALVDDDEENEPYCDCDCEPDDEEDASNRCKSCGKALW